MSTHHSPYGWGAQDLNAARMSRQAPAPRKVPLRRGLLIEDINGWVGEVVKAERIGGALFFGLEDAKGRVKNFPLGPGYLIEGEPVEIVAPVAAKEPKRTISRSGSIAVKNAPARVARAPASGLRVYTTPSSWRRSGVTICALKVLSWSRCTAWMILPVLFVSSRRARAAAWVFWSTT